MYLDEEKIVHIHAALAQLKWYLDTFGEQISRLDHSIECLQDLKEELVEGTDAQSINDYLYSALFQIKQTKAQLNQDIKSIKGYLSDFVESTEEIFKS
ncbi:hypothetical protein GS682_29830 [Nostoc sp. B(2019)]|nr:hypothetical protein [Nostoc sp. B(2019)]